MVGTPAGATASDAVPDGPAAEDVPASQVGPEAPSAVELTELLDGRWAHIRANARRTILTDERFRPAYDLSTEENRARTTEQLYALRAVGYPGLGFPPEYGGTGEVGAALTAFEMLAFGDLSLLVKAGVQWGLFGGAVLHLGTTRHHEAYLREILDLRLLGCFAMTEIAHGSDVQALQTTAIYDPAAEEFVVHTPAPHARKEFIGNAARDARMAAVFAQLVTGGEERGVHCLLVPIRDTGGAAMPGVTIEDCGRKAGLNGVDNGRLSFDHVRVPRAALLDRYGAVARDGTYTSPIESRSRRFFTMLGTLIQGRVSIAGGGVSAAKTALTIAIRYAERRRQFAAPGTTEETMLLDYATHQRRLLIPLAHTYALHFAQAELTEELHAVFSARLSGEPVDDRRQRMLENRAAGTKAISTANADAVIAACREACGGAGYMSSNRLPSLKADTDVFTTFEGDNTVLLQLLGRGLVTNYRHHFGDLDTVGMARAAAQTVLETVIERTAARELIRRLIDAVPGEDEPLRHRGWHLQLFEWRERHVMDGLVRRMKAASDAGMPAAEIANLTSTHLLTAARAHMDRVVLEAFVAGIARAPGAHGTHRPDPGSLADLLDRVCDLHALSVIEADRGWFAEHGRLTARRSKSILADVDRLCAELRPYAGLLVDGFGIPDEILCADLLR